MIDALVNGKLIEKPIIRTKAIEGSSRVSDRFVTCRLRCAMDDGEAAIVSAIAFGETEKAALAALDAGDPVSLAGSLRIGTYEARDGSVKSSINMTVSGVLTAYHVARKRQAARQGSETSQGKQDAIRTTRRPPLSRQTYSQSQSRKPANGGKATLNGAQQAAMMYGSGLPDDNP